MLKNRLHVFLICAVALAILPLALQGAGEAWVRIIDTALFYILLALGLEHRRRHGWPA
jgi:branched-chain amino acid transport system permease protein